MTTLVLVSYAIIGAAAATVAGRIALRELLPSDGLVGRAWVGAIALSVFAVWPLFALALATGALIDRTRP